MYQHRQLLFATGLFCLLFIGCTTPKRNTAYSRWLIGVNTRYNVYHNGIESYKDAIREMERQMPDEYVSLIDIHPVIHLARSQTTNSSFDRAIEKSQKAILTRSLKIKPHRNPSKMRDPRYREFLKQEEYNPHLHNAWLLLSNARYYKGDFINALATNLYISRHFAHLPEVVQEARIGMLQNYVALGWKYEAEDMIHKIEIAGSIPKQTASRYHQAMAQLMLAEGNYKESILHLQNALMEETSKQQRIRMNFLLGQLSALQDDNNSSYRYFATVIKLNPPIEIAFNARIKQTEVMLTNNPSQILTQLRRMERDQHNKTFLDQVYYAMGNIYLKNKDTIQALSYYHRAVDSSKEEGVYKAMPLAALGDIYFAQQKYHLAQPNYSAAAVLLKPTDKQHERLKQRSEVLDELAIFQKNIELQDSLQRLVNMPETERLEIIEQIIEELNQRDERVREHNEQEALSTDREIKLGDIRERSNTALSTPTSNLSNDKSWYFYNLTLVQNGKTAFQQLWGARKPEDNWRRRDKSTFGDMTNDNDSIKSTKIETFGSIHQPISPTNPKEPTYYLAQLPFSPDAIKNSNEIIEESLFAMGRIYSEKLNDYPLSVSTLELLLNRFPLTEKRLEVYHQLFHIGVRTNNSTIMEQYRKRILTEYPDSKQSIALSDSSYMKGAPDSRTVEEELYVSTYQAYLNGNMELVQKNCSAFNEKYPLSKIAPQFLFLHALSHVPAGNAIEFKYLLTELVKNYPQSRVASPSVEMLKGLAQGKKLAKGSSVAKGMEWRSELLGDSLTLAQTILGETKDLSYSTEKECPHLLLLVFNTDSVNVNQLLYDVALFNFNTFATLELDVETRTYDNIGLLIIKGLQSMGEALEYKKIQSTSTELMEKSIQQIAISEHNFELLIKGKSINNYIEFFESEIIRIPNY